MWGIPFLSRVWLLGFNLMDEFKTGVREWARLGFARRKNEREIERYGQVVQ